MLRNVRLNIFLVFLLVSFCTEPFLAMAENVCAEQGILVKNMATVHLWYKRNKGECSIYQKNKIITVKPEESIQVFSDLVCQTSYCGNISYEDLKSSDGNGDCRVRIVSGCALSDM
jgi:hypothetical protein